MTNPARIREAHAHIVGHGRAMSMLHLGDCRDLDQCLDLVRAHAARSCQAWILGVGLRIDGWATPVWPTARDLDRVTGQRPCCLWSFDYHALVVNTSAMRACAIDNASPDPPNGRIVRDSVTGVPTGVMLESAAKMIWAQVPEPAPGERRALVETALADLARHGFVEVHDLLSQPWLGPALAEIHDAGALDMSVLLYPPLAEIDGVAASAPAWTRDKVRLAGAKLFADGTLNSRTASMLHPFADPLPGMPRGQTVTPQGDIAAALEKAWSMGLGLAVHAIGDAAVRATLNAFESAAMNHRLTVSPSHRLIPPLRIEHAEIIDALDVPRFARLGVVASVQPCHLLADIEALRRGIPHRLDRVFPLRELIDSGCRPGELLWFGSDTPIVRPDPGDSIQAAVHRQRVPVASGAMAVALHSHADGPIAPNQAITRAEAWACFAPAGA